MTIYEFARLICDAGCQQVKVYDISDDDCKTIFEGFLDEVPEDLEDMEISSIDNVDGNSDFIGINVDCEE